MGDPLRIGIVGAGKISAAYTTTLARLPQLRVTAIADLAFARAEALAATLPGARALPLADLLASADVDTVLNLTIPAAHFEVATAAQAHGKHVYNEKPLTATVAEARELLSRSGTARVACAPDTVLGTGLQTARAALTAGDIGTPVAATAFMVTPGHELWHPDPEFYYQPGGGPLLDMGPYYLTALIHLLGPVRRVTGMAATPRPTRTIATGPRAGTTFPVTTPTHQTGILEHTGGALTTLMMSFDIWTGRLPRIEVYGTDGTLSVPDPNNFDGDVARYTGRSGDWTTLPESAGYRNAARGYGLLDLAEALAAGTPHRASADLAFHVLDVMESLHTAAATATTVELTSTCTVPAPVPLT